MKSTITYEGLCSDRDALILEWLGNSRKAPVRGSYSKLTGSYAKTKRDYLKELTVELQNLNLTSQALFKKDVWDFDDEEPTLKGKPA